MNTWPDEALTKKMLDDTDAVMASYEVRHTTASSADCAFHVRALLRRVRELEKREAELTAALEKIAGPPDGLRDWKIITAREVLGQVQ